MTAGRKNVGQKQDWGTPPIYVDAVREFFGGVVHLDPCSNRHSVVNAWVEYRLPEHDGLLESWNLPTIYVNPPYGSDREHRTTISHWLRKSTLSIGSPRLGSSGDKHWTLEEIRVWQGYGDVPSVRHEAALSR
jgi:hypothetical protein